MSIWDTPAKDVPRQIVMQSRRQKAKTALTLPGDKMLCVKAGVEAGVFNQHTQHIFVERNTSTQTSIAREMRRLHCEWEPKFWRDELYKMPLRSLLENAPLDFAYLDLCAAINGRVARWVFTELSQAIGEGATIAVTLSRNYRRSKYMTWWNKLLFGPKCKREAREAMKYWWTVERQIRSAECAGMVGDLADYFDDSVITAADGYMLPARGKSKWNRCLQPEYHAASVTALAGLTLLIPQWDYKLKACIEYRRNPEAKTGHWMTTYVLSDFTPAAQSKISENLIQELGGAVEPAMNPILRML